MGNQSQRLLRKGGVDDPEDGDREDPDSKREKPVRRRRRNDNTLQGPSDILTEEEIVDIQVIKGAVVGVKEV